MDEDKFKQTRTVKEWILIRQLFATSIFSQWMIQTVYIDLFHNLSDLVHIGEDKGRTEKKIHVPIGKDKGRTEIQEPYTYRWNKEKTEKHYPYSCKEWQGKDREIKAIGKNKRRTEKHYLYQNRERRGKDMGRTREGQEKDIKKQNSYFYYLL